MNVTNIHIKLAGLPHFRGDTIDQSRHRFLRGTCDRDDLNRWGFDDRLHDISIARLYHIMVAVVADSRAGATIIAALVTARATIGRIRKRTHRQGLPGFGTRQPYPCPRSLGCRTEAETSEQVVHRLEGHNTCDSGSDSTSEHGSTSNPTCNC